MITGNSAPSPRAIAAPFRFPRVPKTLLLSVALVSAIALNIATLTVGAVFGAMSSLVGSAAALVTTKNVTVRGRHQGRMVKLGAKNNAMKTQVRNTTTRISRRIATATARNTSSVFAESIPYAGIGVIAAVTAWEIRDACETMKDLHNLNVAFDPDTANDVDHAEVCGTEVPSKEEIITSVKNAPGKAWAKAEAWFQDPDKFSGLPAVRSWDETKQSTKKVWRKIVSYFDGDW